MLGPSSQEGNARSKQPGGQCSVQAARRAMLGPSSQEGNARSKQPGGQCSVQAARRASQEGNARSKQPGGPARRAMLGSSSQEGNAWFIQCKVQQKTEFINSKHSLSMGTHFSSMPVVWSQVMCANFGGTF